MKGPWLTVKEIFEKPGGAVALSSIINCLNFGVWLWIWIHYWLSLSSSAHFCQSIIEILVRYKAILLSKNEKTKTTSTIPKPLNNCISKLEFKSNIKSKRKSKTKPEEQSPIAKASQISQPKQASFVSIYTPCEKEDRKEGN